MQVITTDKITTMVTYNLVKNALDQEEKEKEKDRGWRSCQWWLIVAAKNQTGDRFNGGHDKDRDQR